jgi:hypothetical protein
MRTSLLIVVLVLSPAALAQTSDEVAGEETGLEGSATVAPMPRTQKRKPAAERDSANAQHTVASGDTLWDLSQKYLGSSWYWPKVWSYNPEIANPHWIFPGNQVRFYQSGEEAPAEVEAGEGGEPEAPDVEEGEMVADEDKVIVTSPIGVRTKMGMAVSLPGLVTPSEIEGSGRIVGSFAQSQMLSFPDIIYVRFDDKRAAKLGETYVVFRPGQRIFHPITGKSAGYFTRIMGEVRVTRVEKNGIVSMQIVRQVDEIERADLIGPSGEPLVRRVLAQPADREILGGVIIAGTPMAKATYGQHSVVVIDRGSEQGVKPGFVFTIWRQHDGLPQDVLMNPSIRDEEMPVEDVGECIAAEVKSNATLCLLSRSLRELVVGDRADIRALGSHASR